MEACHAKWPPSLKSGVWHIRQNCKTIGNAPGGLSSWTESRELTVIKVLTASLIASFKLELDFSDHTHGVFDANAYLASRSGPLLKPLRDPACFRRFFIDAGALCWPNGLEIYPARLHELCAASATA